MSQVVFIFTVAHSGRMSETLVAGPLWDSVWHWGPEVLFRQSSLEITGINARSNQCPAMPFHSVARPAGGPVSLAGNGLMLLFHGAGYCH